MKIFGIDISAHQNSFDFKRAKKEGIKFVILRGAYAGVKDSRFEVNYQKAHANGLDVGVYLYSMAEDEKEAKREAELLYKNCLKGKRFEYPIYYDVEDKIQKKLGKKKMDAIIRTFCNTLEKKGYYVGVYSNLDFYKNYCSGATLAKRYTWWLAYWGGYLPKVEGSIEMWQFGGETNALRTNLIAGVVCDQDYALSNLKQKIKEKGKNGYKKGIKKQNTEVYYVVKKGDTLSAIATKYKTTIQKLIVLNQTSYPKIKTSKGNFIQVGWRILIKR